MMWGWFVSGITLYCRLFTKALRTDQRTDGLTDQRTDHWTDGHTLLQRYEDTSKNSHLYQSLCVSIGPSIHWSIMLLFDRAREKTQLLFLLAITTTTDEDASLLILMGNSAYQNIIHNHTFFPQQCAILSVCQTVQLADRLTMHLSFLSLSLHPQVFHRDQTT